MRKQPLMALFIFLFITILIFFNNNSAPVKFIAGEIQNIFAGPKSYIYGLKTKTTGVDSPEVKKLRSENTALTKKLIDYEKLKRDNEAFRSQFEEAQTHNYRLLPASILGFLGAASSPTSLIIDQGTKSGVKKGMAAVFGSNLVGKIVSSSEYYSKVLLPTDPTFSTVATGSENRAQGIITGARDFILLDRVSIKDKIVAGETVLTMGESDEQGIGIPANLIIGKISSVNKNESLPFQTAKIVGSIGLSNLQTIFIIISF